jgi:hypothetical protein
MFLNWLYTFWGSLQSSVSSERTREGIFGKKSEFVTPSEGRIVRVRRPSTYTVKTTEKSPSVPSFLSTEERVVSPSIFKEKSEGRKVVYPISSGISSVVNIPSGSPSLRSPISPSDASIGSPISPVKPVSPKKSSLTTPSTPSLRSPISPSDYSPVSPPIEKSPSVPSYPYPRPYLDTYYYGEPIDQEIPVDMPYFDKMGEKVSETKKKAKKRLKEEYKYKPRTSPIFGGAEKVFAFNPVEARKIKTTRPRKSRLELSGREFDLGLDNVIISNPFPEERVKSNKVNKVSKVNKNKKQFWET